MPESASLLQAAAEQAERLAEPKTIRPQPSAQDNKIWKAALQRYYDELANGGYKGHAIDKDLLSTGLSLPPVIHCHISGRINSDGLIGGSYRYFKRTSDIYVRLLMW